MMPHRPRRMAALSLGAILVIAICLWNLHTARDGVSAESTTVGGTPVTIHRPADGRAGPVVVVAHGFAGSRQLMQSFALTFARNGYIAVTFDFPGHGRNPQPMTGDITKVSGTTQMLVEETRKVAAFSRGLGDGRLAVLGHSMASDIVVRFAEQYPDVAATIAVSMFSPAVTASSPRNLLVIVGDWEGMLKREALRAVGLSISPRMPMAEVTYGAIADGTARRAAFSPHVEHVGVLFSRSSMLEALQWLDLTFGIVRAGTPEVAERGPWILLLLAALVVLARPMSALLPRVCSSLVGASLPWRRLWPSIAVPMVATPALLRVIPTHFLPVVVGDYLAVHFAAYGAITALCLYWTRSARVETARRAESRTAFAIATLAVITFGFVGIFWTIDSEVTSFVPDSGRIGLVLAMLVGTSCYFLSDEWLTRGAGAARGAYFASKAAFLLSLALAVALDFRHLFFLIIIVPIIVLFFVVYGLFSAWTYRSTGHPWVAGVANALAFAWAIGVTFPQVAG